MKSRCAHKSAVKLLSHLGVGLKPLLDLLTESYGLRTAPEPRAMTTSQMLCRRMTLPKRSLGLTTTILISHSRNGKAKAKHASGLSPRMRPRMETKRAMPRRFLLRSCQLHTDREMLLNPPSLSFLRLRHLRNVLPPHRGLSGGPGLPMGYFLPLRSDLA